jgi:hypothetical protein
MNNAAAAALAALQGRRLKKTKLDGSLKWGAAFELNPATAVGLLRIAVRPYRECTW